MARWSENKARKVSKAHRENKALKARRVFKVCRVFKALKEKLVRQAHKVRPEPLAPPGHKAPRETKVTHCLSMGISTP